MEQPAHLEYFGEAVWRTVVASVAGGVLGLPAELRRRPGGIRTHALVSLGAALFCLTAEPFTGASHEAITRIIQGVLTGVGFIGGAAVMRDGGTTIRGLNTGASLWIAASIGCAVALARTPMLGILGAAVAMLIDWSLLVFERRRPRLPPSRPEER